MKLLINPKAPKYVVEYPELYQNSGWDMDDSKCRFSVKHKVGDIIKCLIISNRHDDNSYIDKDSEISYFIGEVMGYYSVGYGIISIKIIYLKDKNNSFYKVGDYHSLHHGWVDNAENPKLLNDLKKIRGKEVFIFR